ncbi:MAG TPA: hypothetical protein VD838_14565, partial [Anaeromyxobacteraceae bacterium]|nr:hypothetical protein [Anaeromyxobacteraceae bacterium]
MSLETRSIPLSDREAVRAAREAGLRHFHTSRDEGGEVLHFQGPGAAGAAPRAAPTVSGVEG